MPIVADAFVCPSCRGALDGEDLALRCPGCGALVPNVGDIPCLFHDAAGRIDDWRRAAHKLGATAQRNLNAVSRQLGEASGLTAARLELLHRGLEENACTVSRLLEDAGLWPLDDGTEPRVNLMDGYVQTLRDWAWEDTDENALALEDVVDVSGRVLVLGAGACRLAVDLHQKFKPAHTVVLDINPLPFLVAKRTVSGQRLPLWEFPATPRGDVCVLRHTRALAATMDAFTYVFADALHHPARAGAFDTVITPWFIDQVPRDIAAVLPMLHRALKPEGSWINIGPLIYQRTTETAKRYGIDEVVALSQAAGWTFADPPTRHRRDYLCSDASSQGRIEEVYTFTARRDDREPAAPPPLWLTRSDVPIGRWPALARYDAPNPFFAAVAERIDGDSSARDIAAALVAALGIPEEGAEQGVHITVQKIYASSDGGDHA